MALGGISAKEIVIYLCSGGRRLSFLMYSNASSGKFETLMYFDQVGGCIILNINNKFKHVIKRKNTLNLVYCFWQSSVKFIVFLRAVVLFPLWEVRKHFTDCISMMKSQREEGTTCSIVLLNTIAILVQN